MIEQVRAAASPPLVRRWGRYARLCIPLLAAGLLVWMLDRIGWNVLLSYSVSVGWLGAAALLAVGVIENLFQALALRRAIGVHVPVLRVLAVNGIGSVVNSIIPWEAGEVAKGALLSSHVSRQSLVSGLILWNYLLKLTAPAVSLFAAMLALAVGWNEIDTGIGLSVVLACLLGLLPYAALRIVLRRGAAGLIVRLLSRFRLIRKNPEVLLASAFELDARIRAFRDERPRDLAALLAYQVLSRLAAWLSWGVVLYFMNYPCSFSHCALVFSGFSVASYLTAIIPTRIGVSEGTGYLIFALYGLDGPTGLIATALERAKSLLCNGAAGLFALGSGARHGGGEAT